MKSFVQLLFLAAAFQAHYVSAGEASPQGQLGAPAAAYIFDAAVKGIRPVLGIPGASSIGDPLDLGLSLASAVVSPNQDFAVLVGADDAAVRILSLQTGDFANQLLTQALNAPKRIFFSPGGGTVGLYYRDSERLQIFTHMPLGPVLAWEISTASLSGDMLSAAISDDGDLALIVTGKRNHSATWLSRAGADPVQLPQAQGPLSIAPGSTAAISFRSGSHDAVTATWEGQISLVRDIDISPSLQVLSPPDDRTSDAVAVQESADGTRTYVATRQGTVASIDSQTGSAIFISCGCTPSGLFPFHPPTLLRLNDLSNGPLMLFDASDAHPRVWFVPAVAHATGAARKAQ